MIQFATARRGSCWSTSIRPTGATELEYAMNKVECKALVLGKTLNYLEIASRPHEGRANCRS